VLFFHSNEGVDTYTYRDTPAFDDFRKCVMIVQELQKIMKVKECECTDCVDEKTWKGNK